MAKVKCPRCMTVNPDGQERCQQCQAPLPRIRIEATPPPPVGQSPQTTFRPGQTIANRYSVINLVGRGGMGCIYKVFDNTLQEEVALKTLLPQFVRDKMVVERFFNEARIARKMAHPNVVRVHDIGAEADTVYISMEFLAGQSLRQILERLPAGKRMPIKQVLHIMNGLCDALEYAHQFTVHRDIKPENVMIAPDGTVKLMDFGISKLMANVRMTGASVVMGTPFYMSPEQLRNSRDVDARADLYSVGVMLYEILTGNMPTGVPKPASQMISDVPPALDQIVAKCVEPDPANRYQSAAELREALRPIRELVDAGKDFRTLAKGNKKGMAIRGKSVLGFLLALCVLGGAVWGIGYAEERREAGASAGAALQTTFSYGADDVSAELDAIAALIRDLEATTSTAVIERPLFADLLETGAARWEEAREEARNGNPDNARRLGREALQYYAAPLFHNDMAHMVFIPAGTIATAEGMSYVPAFFIDEAEVSYGDFARFCREAPGGWRDQFRTVSEAYESFPVNNITYYDAQAYAAFYGKRLPSIAQWLLAALGPGASPNPYPWGTEWNPGNCNCDTGAPEKVRANPRDKTPTGLYDMLGNVAEWTRSPQNNTAATPDFGVNLIIAGGHFAAGQRNLEQTAQLPYSGYSEHVGFRCILEIPDTVPKVQALRHQKQHP